jgi:uncharacterized membrane protein YsdA (DUF1294 family)
LTARPRYRALLGALVVGALVTFTVLAMATRIQPYLVWLAAWSVATFAAYAIDKSQARRGSWRIPENGLHGLAVAGGAIGGWVGMLGLRHKTRHPVFPLVLAVALTAQVLIGIRLLS